MILVAAVFAGLLGPLVLSLTVLAAVQLPGLIALRDTPVAAGVHPRPGSAPDGAGVEAGAGINRTPKRIASDHADAKIAGAFANSSGGCNTSGKFWAMVLLFIWAYWDLTASSILAPIGMTPVTVRLYNLMHYGQIAALSAMTCAAFAAPILIFLLALGTRRWWAPR